MGILERNGTAALGRFLKVKSSDEGVVVHTLSTDRISLAVVAIIEMQSIDGQDGTIPPRDMSPSVAFRPNIPERAGGTILVPQVSVVTAKLANPVLTATEAPALPPGARLGEAGFFGTPKDDSVPVKEAPN